MEKTYQVWVSPTELNDSELVYSSIAPERALEAASTWLAKGVHSVEIVGAWDNSDAS